MWRFSQKVFLRDFIVLLLLWKAVALSWFLFRVRSFSRDSVLVIAGVRVSTLFFVHRRLVGISCLMFFCHVKHVLTNETLRNNANR